MFVANDKLMEILGIKQTAECYIKYRYPKLERDVYQKLVTGSRPRPVPTDYTIKRKDEDMLH